MTEKDRHELVHWLNTNCKAGIEFVAALIQTLKWWELPLEFTGDVLEIGPGPYGGALPYITYAKSKASIDPLNSEYLKNNILTKGHNIEHINADFDSFNFHSRKFDMIISSNSLDHGSLGEHSIYKIFDLLRPSGLFYLRVHLRPKSGLDKIHDHSLSGDVISNIIKEVQAKPLKVELLDRDVYRHGTIPTYMGVWRKQ